jgi:hypothetical protein
LIRLVHRDAFPLLNGNGGAREGAATEQEKHTHRAALIPASDVASTLCRVKDERSFILREIQNPTAELTFPHRRLYFARGYLSKGTLLSMTLLSTSLAIQATSAANAARAFALCASTWNVAPVAGCPFYGIEGLRSQEKGNVRDHGPPGHLKV